MLSLCNTSGVSTVSQMWFRRLADFYVGMPQGDLDGMDVGLVAFNTWTFLPRDWPTTGIPRSDHTGSIAGQIP